MFFMFTANKLNVKKTFYLLLLLVATLAATKPTSAQTSWLTKKIDDRLSVKFPGEPQKTTKNGVDSYIFKGSDSISYSSAFIDFKVVAYADSAALAPIKDTQRFADQLKAGSRSKGELCIWRYCYWHMEKLHYLHPDRI
jgi:hypothetical protein